MADKKNELMDLLAMKTQGYVVQDNRLIVAKQSLSRAQAMLIRLAITQCQKNDTGFKEYKVSLKKFCDLLGLNMDVYCGGRIRQICSDILKNPVYIEKDGNFVMMPWVQRCEYRKPSKSCEGVITIKLNDELSPYLLGLSDYYTQYMLDVISTMETAYGIRVYELLNMKMMGDFSREGATVELTVDEIRVACDCEKKYKSISMLKSRVIDSALNDIDDNTVYSVSYQDVLEGKKVVGFRFHVTRGFNKMLSAVEYGDRHYKGKVYQD